MLYTYTEGEAVKILKKTHRSVVARRRGNLSRDAAVIRVSKAQFDEITSGASSPVESALVAMLRERRLSA